jgi:RimJ/RimL family protein N-acetyltransferase
MTGAHRLHHLTDDELSVLAVGQMPDAWGALAEAEAMPPAFVARRALATPCSSYLVLRIGDGRVVGACGFKSAPRLGRVDIGYGIAPAGRGAGAATDAVRLLAQIARSDGLLELMAEILPDNAASARVVGKLGFEARARRIDDDGDEVVQWVLALTPAR